MSGLIVVNILFPFKGINIYLQSIDFKKLQMQRKFRRVYVCMCNYNRHIQCKN